jgi:hypothetical protein
MGGVFRAILIPLISLLLAAPAAAQQVISARAGFIYYSEGAVFFDGKPARSLAGTRYPAISEGQLISTQRGHTEILLGAAAVLWVGQNSKIRMEGTSLDDTRIRIEEGSAMIEIREIPDGNRIRALVGEAALDLTRPGVYRIDADLPSLRVYDGDYVSTAARVKQEQELRLLDNTVARFDRKQPDEFQYWAAWRSYQLAGETGFDARGWNLGLYRDVVRHSGFGIEFPVSSAAARLQYLTAANSGLVYFLKGGAMLGGRNIPNSVRLPFQLPAENTLATDAGESAEIFLGVGVVARIGENARVRITTAELMDASILLYEGKTMIEVARAGEEAQIRVKVGASITDLVKPGLYEFDATAGELRVFGGEALTISADKTVKSRQGQLLSLGDPKLTRFDRTQKDSLYQWAYERSLLLARSNTSFMTQWERVGRLLRHPQFGSVDRRSGR